MVFYFKSYLSNMKKIVYIIIGLIVATSFTIFFPPIILYFIGCIQVGYWFGRFLSKKLNDKL